MTCTIVVIEGSTTIINVLGMNSGPALLHFMTHPMLQKINFTQLELAKDQLFCKYVMYIHLNTIQLLFRTSQKTLTLLLVNLIVEYSFLVMTVLNANRIRIRALQERIPL
ncbi:hypothetical protein GDO78_005610 [Eleutherodactylus coqui]|uniref:Uncharacterized protein n=1 Tax=Eleutherodactylus coqui TaxID=57060 RepID=A0A8J6KEA7_ELECQ|nr:hypothetical protein GDO78_005610 [Eleutherodactylus coqui]